MNRCERRILDPESRESDMWKKSVEEYFSYRMNKIFTWFWLNVLECFWERLRRTREKIKKEKETCTREKVEEDAYRN